MTDGFSQAIKESYLRGIALTFQEKSRSNNLCQAWITELFPDLDMIKEHGIASLLMTHLPSYSIFAISIFANEDMKKYCLGPLFKALDSRGGFRQFCDAKDPESTTSMVTGLLYGQMAYPSFPVVNKLLRLSYTAKKRQMFSDVFIFDKCRYVYEQFPTVYTSVFSFYEVHQQMVFRMVVDGMRKHLRTICESDVFSFCNVASCNAMKDGGVESFSTAWPRIPKRQRVERRRKCLSKGPPSTNYGKGVHKFFLFFLFLQFLVDIYIVEGEERGKSRKLILCPIKLCITRDLRFLIKK